MELQRRKQCLYLIEGLGILPDTVINTQRRCARAGTSLRVALVKRCADNWVDAAEAFRG